MLILADPETKRSVANLFTDGDAPYASPSFGEVIPVEVGIVDKAASPQTQRLWTPRDLTGWTIRAAIGNGFVMPVAGTFTLTLGANTTTGLSFDATAQQVEDALQLLASVIAAGGLDVTGSAGYFIVTFRSEANQSLLSIDAENLAPPSIGEVGELIEGTAVAPGLNEVQTIRLFQQPAAYAALTTDSDVAAATITEVVTGGGGANHKVRLTFDPLPYDGTLSLSVGGIESDAIAWDATGATLQASLEAMARTTGSLLTGSRYKIVEYKQEGTASTSGTISNAKKYKITNYVSEGIELTSGALVSGRKYTITNYVEEGANLTSGTVTSAKRYKIKTFVPLGPSLISGAIITGKQYKLVEYVQEGANLTSGTIATGKLYKIVSYEDTGSGDFPAPGVLVIGTLYAIRTYYAPDNFTNVGATANAEGVIFRATGTTPTSWAAGTDIQEVDDFLNLGAVNNLTGTIFRATGTTPNSWTDGTILTAVDDFINVGGSNVEGETFTASGTTPTNWTNNSILKRVEDFSNIGATNTQGEVFLSTGTTPTSWTAGSVLHLVDDFTNLGALFNATDVTFTATGTTPNSWTNLSTLVSVDDFTNVGAAANATGVVFTSTGTTPATWVNGSTLALVDDFTNIGAASNATGVVFLASANTPSAWTAGSVVTPVGVGNVTVSKEEEGSYLISFRGDMANFDMGTITTSADSLRVLATKSGLLDLRTAGMSFLLGAADSASAVFEVEGTPPAGQPQKLYRKEITVVEGIINPAALTDTPGSVTVGGAFTVGGTLDVSGVTTLNSLVVLQDSIRLRARTVAGLPVGTEGDVCYVTDATAPTYHAPAVGGGAIKCPVFFDGTNWIT